MSTTQKLSLTGAILMNVNLMVGASAFTGPSMMAHYAGAASFYGWIFAAIIFFPVVWCVAQITEYFPGQGSFYSYSKNTLSESAGFLSGWVYFWGYVSIGSLQLSSLNSILAHQWNIGFIQSHPLLFDALLLGVLIVLASLSVHHIDRIQSSATLLKLTPLVIGVCSLFYYFNPAQTPFITQASPITLIPTIPMAIFGFWGFEGICSVSHLIEESKKNTPRAIFLGFTITVLVYALFHMSLISIMGAPALAAQGAAAFPSFMNLSSPFIAHILNIIISSAIVIALANAIFGGVVANSAMLCTMAEEKLLFASSFFATRTPHSQRPIGTILAHAAGIFFCVSILKNKEILNAMSNLGILIAFFLTIIGLITIQKRQNEKWSLILSSLALGSCSLLSYYSWQIMGNTLWERFMAASPVLGAIAIGFGMFLYTQQCTKKKCA